MAVTWKSIRWEAGDLEEQYFRAMAVPAQPIPTGIDGLDAVLDGGLPQGLPTYVAAPAGTGKSVLGIQIAGNTALSGIHTVVVSHELTSQQVINRLLSSVYAHSAWQFGWANAMRGGDPEVNALLDQAALDGADDATFGRIIDEAAMRMQTRTDIPVVAAWTAYRELLLENLVVIDDVNDLKTITDLIGALNNTHQRFLVVDDYVQAIDAGEGELSESERMQFISRELTKAIKGTRGALLGVSMTSKIPRSDRFAYERGDDMPSVDIFRGSSQLGFDAGVGLAMFRDETGDTLPMSGYPAMRGIHCYVLKNRAGRSGMDVPLCLDGENNKIYDRQTIFNQIPSAFGIEDEG